MSLQTHFNFQMLAGFAVALLVILFSAVAPAQYANDLIGQPLERKADTEAAIQDGLFGLLSGVELPSIESVTVAAVEPEALVLSVRSGAAQSFSLVASLLREDGRIETRIPDVVLSPAGDNGTAELRFKLPQNITEGATFSTAYVRFQAQRFGRALPGVEWRYPLIKQWSKPIAPENVVIRITAQPIGKAADLPTVLQSNRPLPKPAVLRFPPEAIRTEYKLQHKSLNQALLSQAQGNYSAAVRTQQQANPQARIASGNAPITAAAPANGRAETVQPQQPEHIRQLTTANRIASPALQLSTKQKDILQSTQLARARLPERSLNVLQGLKKEERDRGARGPSSQTIDLISVIHADVDVSVNHIIGIKRELYLDQNPDSGVLYYVPEDYNLHWSPNDGFALKMLYAAVAEGAPGKVMVALRLAAGVQAHDDALIQDLAKAYRTLRNNQLKVDIIRPLPVTSQHPIVNLSDAMNVRFDVTDEDLVATVFSDVLEELEVAWSADEITKQNIDLTLGSGEGISGKILFELESQPPATIFVPANIQLANSATFGRIDWQRSSPWRNPTPYPLHLMRIHALIFEDDTPIVYSWDLANREVPPQAQVEWDVEHIPAWVDGKARRMWVEYSVNADCEECNRQVLRDLSYGASQAASRQEILIAALSPLDDIGAAELAVHLRSRYFDSTGESLSLLAPVIVNTDRSEYNGGLVYLVDRQPGEERPNDPLFEYQIEVVMPDGSVHSPAADRWIESHRNRIVIGRVQIEQSLGYLPGTAQ